MRYSIVSLLSILLSSTDGSRHLLDSDCAATPPNTTFSSTPKLPNPFKFLNGTLVTTRAQWACRREEIRTLILGIEYGPYPSTLPRSNITAAYKSSNNNTTDSKPNGTIAISVTSPFRTTSITSKISFPAGEAAKKPHPVVVVWGGANIPVPSYAAVVTYKNDEIASVGSQSSRGRGKFYDAYPSLRSTTGAYAGIAWGLSRILDALEILSEELGIDASKVAITGCSRNAKSVLLAGAMDERVTVTIPQEGGEGGDNCWRIRDSIKQGGGHVTPCDEIECPPDYTPYSPKFASYVSKTSTMPFDHHMLAALIAPRGLFVIENDIDWLMPVAGLGCMSATRMVYDALRVQNAIGWSLEGAHSHCQFPKEKQGAELDAFFEYFLRGGLPANVWRSRPEKNIVLSDWIDWKLPNLT